MSARYKSYRKRKSHVSEDRNYLESPNVNEIKLQGYKVIKLTLILEFSFTTEISQDDIINIQIFPNPGKLNLKNYIEGIHIYLITTVIR